MNFASSSTAATPHFLFRWPSAFLQRQSHTLPSESFGLIIPRHSLIIRIRPGPKGLNEIIFVFKSCFFLKLDFVCVQLQLQPDDAALLALEKNQNAGMFRFYFLYKGKGPLTNLNVLILIFIFSSKVLASGCCRQAACHGLFPAPPLCQFFVSAKLVESNSTQFVKSAAWSRRGSTSNQVYSARRTKALQSTKVHQHLQLLLMIQMKQEIGHVKCKQAFVAFCPLF